MLLLPMVQQMQLLQELLQLRLLQDEISSSIFLQGVFYAAPKGVIEG
jgi:hypothetical protein